VSFTISAVDDADIESFHSDTVTISMNSQDPDYNSPPTVVGSELRGIDSSLLQVDIDILDNDVEATLDTTPAPILSRAFLVETAHEIELVFDRATTRAGRALGLAGRASCQSMNVLDAGTLLSVGGAQAACYWPSST